MFRLALSFYAYTPAYGTTFGLESMRDDSASRGGCMYFRILTIAVVIKLKCRLQDVLNGYPSTVFSDISMPQRDSITVESVVAISRIDLRFNVVGRLRVQ